MDYMFNFCKNVPTKCKGKLVSAYEVLEVLGQMTDTCEILGIKETETVTQLVPGSPRKGIKVTYSGGDICTGSENASENGNPRKISFNVNCASNQDSNFVQTKINPPIITKCNLEFSINSPAGCPMGISGGLSSSFVILMGLILIAAFYVLAGYIYNSKLNGKLGLEAVPGIEFFKEMPSLAAEGVNFFIDIVKTGVAKITKSGGGSVNKGWSQV